VFWVHAGTQARFEEGFRMIIEATKMDGWDDPKANVLRLVRGWLCNESNGRWLMVVDNADDASVFFQDMSQTGDSLYQSPAELLADFLPQSPNGSILITSRSRDVAYKLTGSHSSIVEVKPMDEDAAMALLQRKLGYIDGDDQALELINILDAMPLALTQAAAFIKQRAPRMSVSKYVDEVRRSEHDRARLLNKDVGDSRRDGRASNSIITTWHISFKHLRTKTPTAARLLSLMSLFDRQGIPASLLHDQYGSAEDEEADIEDDISALTNFSLVEVSADGSEFEMHRLVQFSTKKWLELSNELEGWKATYAMLMNESYPVGRHENWPVCQRLFPHAEVVLNNQPENEEARKAWASVLFKAAWYASEMGQYNRAYEMGSVALQAREVVLGTEHPDTLSSLNGLGLVVRWQGHYDKAAIIFEQVVEVYRRALGADHPNTLNSMANLASTYADQGWWTDAEALEVQVLEARKVKLGADHPDTLSSMGNLASTYRNQGQWTDAEALEVQVMEASKTKLEADHPFTLRSMANLASTYWEQGQWTNAEALEVQVLEARKVKLGADHPDTLTSLGNLAATYNRQGRWTDAEALQMQVMEARKTKLGANHPDTLNSMNNLAVTLKEQGFTSRAISLMEDCCKRLPAVLGRQHPYAISSCEALRIWQLEAVENGCSTTESKTD
jgi:tetratricopeptide (TPR) repeat protein